MSLPELRTMSVRGFVLVGLVTTVGAAVVSLLVAGVVQAGLTIDGWLARLRLRDAEAGGHAATTAETRAVGGSLRLNGSADHALLARQAWWRLRC